MKESGDEIVVKAASIFEELKNLLREKQKRKAIEEVEEIEEADEELEEAEEDGEEEEEENDNEDEANEDDEEDEEEEEEKVVVKKTVKRKPNKKQKEEEKNEEDEEGEEEKVVVKKIVQRKTNKKQKEEEKTEIKNVHEKKELLIQKYTKLASKKNSFGKGSSWHTLKFNVLKDCTAAQYYVVEMEFSNDEEGEQLNIWLKASHIHDVLKCLADDDPDTLPLFNGFEDVIRNAHLGELRVKPYGENVCRANKKNGYTYKDFVNYYLIPKEKGAFKATVEKFKNTMVKLLNSDHFFSLMTVYQNERTNNGGQPGKVLRDGDSDVWQQLKKENNSELKYMDALNAKFMDDIIIVILHKLFGEDSIMAKYQKFGWDNRESGPFAKSKKN